MSRDRRGPTIRIEKGWLRDPFHQLRVTRSQNPHWDTDPAPYRHAAFNFRYGPLGLAVWAHNNHGRTRLHRGSAYWSFGDSWGWGAPRTGLFRMTRYP